MASIERRERIIADLVAISSESESADLLAGLPPRIVNPLSNIHSSINYTPCSVNGYYGAVQWIGTYLIRLATDLEHMSKWMHVCAIITRFRGLGRLLLYELSGKFIGRVRLECIMEIWSTPHLIHGFHIYLEEGCNKVLCMELATGEVSEKQSYCMSQRFLQEVVKHVPERCAITSMVHAGFLDKAVTGELSIFRRRWCVLFSSGLLVHYKQEKFVRSTGEI